MINFCLLFATLGISINLFCKLIQGDKMRQTLISVIFGASLLGFGVNAANSAVIVDQSFDSGAVVGGTNFSEDVSRIYDDFSLTDTTILNKITIWASHWSSGVVPSVLDFGINFYNDTGTSLGSLVTSSTLSVVSSTDTGIDHNNNGSANILAYELSFDSAVSLDAGDYFLSVFLQTDAPGTYLAWQRINTSGRSIQYTLGSPTSWGDLAWKLESTSDATPVPVPAAFALLPAGLGLLGFMGWSRKRKAG